MVRVYAVSDLHADVAQNMEWCEALPKVEDSVLLCAGDVATDLGKLSDAFTVLQDKFDIVYYTPGNHELWATQGHEDSLAKLAAVLKMCDSLGVRTAPELLPAGVFIVPLMSWPHESWDREPGLALPPGETLARPVEPVERVITDYGACKWPAGLENGSEALAKYFDELNDLDALLAVRRAGYPTVPMVSMSHFLPRQSLLPEKRFLFQPNLAKAVGSDFLEPRIRALDSDVHVFGHTHFSWDATFEGTRYVQHCLGTPDEAARREVFQDGIHSGMNTPRLVWDTAADVPEPDHKPYWSAFYEDRPRDPLCVEMAEYVARVYCPNAPRAALPVPHGLQSKAKVDASAESMARRLRRFARPGGDPAPDLTPRARALLARSGVN